MDHSLTQLELLAQAAGRRELRLALGTLNITAAAIAGVIGGRDGGQKFREVQRQLEAGACQKTK